MNARILMIGGRDGQFWAEQLRRTLGPDVTIDRGGEVESLDLAATQPYALVFVVAEMVVDVARLVTRIREQQPQTKVVVATASPTWTTARAVFQAGAAEYLTSTMTQEERREMLSGLLEQHTASPQPSPQRIARSGVPVILLADNDPTCLRPRKEYLELFNYQVVAATSAGEATRLLESGNIDLAILDIRLEDDSDERDKSGLLLAQHVAPGIPKIILTGYPSYEDVRTTLHLEVPKLPPAVNFLSKQEGMDTLLQAVREALGVPAAPAGRGRVLIVHGHADAATAVRRVIEQLGFTPIGVNLRQHPGDTIVAALETYPDIRYAAVVLTADDRRAHGQPAATGTAAPSGLFELGYLLGKLGPGKVSVLYGAGVEPPRVYDEVIYIQLDPANDWEQAYARALKLAGSDGDLG